MPQIPLSDNTDIDLGPLSTDLLFMVRTLQSMLRPDGHTMRKALDTESGMIGLLSIIWLKPGISQNELASVVALKKSAVTKLITKMEDRGLVLRSKDSADKRINNLTLTDAGEQMIHQSRIIAQQLNERLFQGVSGSDQETFFQVFWHIFSRLATEGAQISLEDRQPD
mgnify:FL=1